MALTKVPTQMMGAGAVLQVVSVANTGTGSGTSNTFSDIVTGVTITPSSSTSKILLLGMTTLTFMAGDEWFTKVQVSVNGGAYSDVGSNSFGNTGANAAGYTATGVGWQIMTVPIHFLYSPATTSALTFKTLATGQNAGGATYYYNRTGGSSGTDSGSAISVLTAMEIAA